jgi:hypothetical protein
LRSTLLVPMTFAWPAGSALSAGRSVVVVIAYSSSLAPVPGRFELRS